MSTATIKERVATGVAFLDEHDPDWWQPGVPNAIDLDRLDLGEPDICILGQRCPITVLAEYCGLEPAHVAYVHHQRSYLAYGHYLSGLGNSQEIFAWAVDCGFNSAESDDAGDEEYEALTAEWKRVILERRETAVPA